MQPVVYNAATAIVPSDTVNQVLLPHAELMDAIWVGGAGIVVAVFANDMTANFTCTAGQLLPVRCKRVNASVTTATLMVALYQV